MKISDKRFMHKYRQVLPVINMLCIDLESLLDEESKEIFDLNPDRSVYMPDLKINTIPYLKAFVTSVCVSSNITNRSIADINKLSIDIQHILTARIDAIVKVSCNVVKVLTDPDYIYDMMLVYNMVAERVSNDTRINDKIYELLDVPQRARVKYEDLLNNYDAEMVQNIATALCGSMLTRLQTLILERRIIETGYLEASLLHIVDGLYAVIRDNTEAKNYMPSLSDLALSMRPLVTDIACFTDEYRHIFIDRKDRVCLVSPTDIAEYTVNAVTQMIHGSIKDGAIDTVEIVIKLNDFMEMLHKITSYATEIRAKEIAKIRSRIDVDLHLITAHIIKLNMEIKRYEEDLE